MGFLKNKPKKKEVTQMVKRLKKHHTKKHISKGCKDNGSKLGKIKASAASTKLGQIQYLH
tara:strand:- start:525 stop:704 length:180 start_codon:yes stop_codon:yes gene_type:complete